MRLAYALVCSLLLAMSLPAAAGDTCPDGGTALLACQVAPGGKRLSVCVDQTDATYRFGPAGAAPELTLTTPLSELDYRRKNGPGNTIDEHVTFRSGNHAYRLAMGFRSGIAPDRSAYHPFGELTVTRGDAQVAALACQPDTIERWPDLLLDRMRAIGREKSSDGDTFPNYTTERPLPASQSPACEQADNTNVDTCWSRGVVMSRWGNLAGALAHFEMSCAARSNLAGCYDAAKLHLLNRGLRDYARAYEEFKPVCDNGDIGFKPYACKYLGWMHQTGTGVARDRKTAFDFFVTACYPDDDLIVIDAEGCQLLAEDMLKPGSAVRSGLSGYIAYLSLAMGCTEAKDLCERARTLYDSALRQPAAWIDTCERELDGRPPLERCANLIATDMPGVDRDEVMRTIRGLFRNVAADLE